MVDRETMVPEGRDPEHHYFAIVEGTPSLSLGVGIKASMASGQRLMDPEDPSSDPGYWATIATVLQAVPRVCAGPRASSALSSPISTGCRTSAISPGEPLTATASCSPISRFFLVWMCRWIRPPSLACCSAAVRCTA